MAYLKPNSSLNDFQRFIWRVYGLPDDRLYSFGDLLTQQQRFTMRMLKGIRKKEEGKVETNLLISLSWLMAIANRLHIDLENHVWERFPGYCSYCAECPCACAEIRPEERISVPVDESQRPQTIAGLQEMFESIYPSSDRTLAEAGVHLAEEMGEVSEALHNFLGQHKEEQFNHVVLEAADFVSCLFGVANSSGIPVEEKLVEMYHDNCHICHDIPCTCNFDQVVRLET